MTTSYLFLFFLHMLLFFIMYVYMNLRRVFPKQQRIHEIHDPAEIRKFCETTTKKTVKAEGPCHGHHGEIHRCISSVLLLPGGSCAVVPRQCGCQRIPAPGRPAVFVVVRLAAPANRHKI